MWTITLRVALVAAPGLMVMATDPARAAILVTASEVGSDVVLTGSGTADLAGLSLVRGNLIADPFVFPSDPGLIVGKLADANVDAYKVLVGPSNFGSGGMAVATSGEGDLLGLSATLGSGSLSLLVPAHYVSGAALSGTATFADQSFASLGMTPGTYEWTWGTGADADSFTLQIGPAAVPEPSSAAMAGLGAVTGAGVCWRRRRAGANA